MDQVVEKNNSDKERNKDGDINSETRDQEINPEINNKQDQK